MPPALSTFHYNCLIHAVQDIAFADGGLDDSSDDSF